MPLGQLRAGYDRLHRALKGQPSRYAGASDGALEVPALSHAWTKTGSKTGNRVGKVVAAAE
jgi:hypothetical protein